MELSGNLRMFYKHFLLTEGGLLKAPKEYDPKRRSEYVPGKLTAAPCH